MENPIKMDDLGGKPAIFGNTHILITSLLLVLVLRQQIHLPLPFRLQRIRQLHAKNPLLGLFSLMRRCIEDCMISGRQSIVLSPFFSAPGSNCHKFGQDEQVEA